MQGSMVCVLHQDEIFKPIVLLVEVDVVDDKTLRDFAVRKNPNFLM